MPARSHQELLHTVAAIYDEAVRGMVSLREDVGSMQERIGSLRQNVTSLTKEIEPLRRRVETLRDGMGSLSEPAGPLSETTGTKRHGPAVAASPATDDLASRHVDITRVHTDVSEVRAELTRVRAGIMDRIDRLQDRLSQRNAEVAAGHPATEEAERVARTAREEVRALGDLVIPMIRRICRLEDEVRSLRSASS